MEKAKCIFHLHVLLKWLVCFWKKDVVVLSHDLVEVVVSSGNATKNWVQIPSGARFMATVPPVRSAQNTSVKPRSSH